MSITVRVLVAVIVDVSMDTALVPCWRSRHAL